MQRLLETELGNLNFVTMSVDSVVEAKRALDVFDPDIALIDISLKGNLNGLHLGHMLAKTHPGLAQIYLTKLDDSDASSFSGMGFPEGSGYLSKHRIHSPSELFQEIERVVQGKPRVNSDQGETADVFAELGAKGLQVLELLAEGFSNQHIASTMGLSTKTVEYYTESVYKFLGVEKSPERNARVEAAVRYQRMIFTQGLFSSDSES